MSSKPPISAAERARDVYMQEFSDMFSSELVELYEHDGGPEAVRHLTSCIENGVAVWGHPMCVPSPFDRAPREAVHGINACVLEPPKFNCV